MKRTFQDHFLKEQFELVSKIKSKSLLTHKPNSASTNQIPLVVTFNKTLPK